ncbi:DNA polymerase III subunit chi [Uliginosibacterium sp. 31-16]|uniref:DNA polymerase III subunit chi n=1 Tax=Uliginosibacterium sp. 31-16 TaxID=3068315 RepID=UPI00273E8936|nr:DNA polymerase III subunit chi [Uliginosibacterium sp. 31-16]MDP5241197.1 DNA polymerase III subunit chi [Uliginosibacterium sp. 31-16]
MDVKFYHNASDRLRAACAITAKAVRQGRKVVVYAPEPGLAKRYDSLLWAAQPLSFVPHVAASSPLAARTPVVMAQALNDLPYDDVLINLADDLPDGYERFQLLVEIVAADEAGRSAARARWRFYKEHRHTVQAYDLTKTES